MPIRNTLGGEAWRILRIVGEFVDGIDTLARLDRGVSIFGSARTPEDHPAYQQAREMGAEFARRGRPVITGGGPGIMEAANRGAHELGGISIGLNIVLPHEQVPNPYQTHELVFDYFFVRKVMFIRHACALVNFPGGFGTMDEFFESMTLIQTQKVGTFPVVLIGRDYWSGLVDWMRETMLERYSAISPEDMDLFHLTDDVHEGVEYIEHAIAERPAMEPEHTGEGTRSGVHPRHPVPRDLDPDEPAI